MGIRSVHSEATADISDVGRDAGGVGRNQIATEALKGADSVEAIGKRLKAGTNCGACRPEIAKLLQVSARMRSLPELLRLRGHWPRQANLIPVNAEPPQMDKPSFVS